jgi:hypothetical protein
LPAWPAGVGNRNRHQKGCLQTPPLVFVPKAPQLWGVCGALVGCLFHAPETLPFPQPRSVTRKWQDPRGRAPLNNNPRSLRPPNPVRRTPPSKSHHRAPTPPWRWPAAPEHTQTCRHFESKPPSPAPFNGARYPPSLLSKHSRSTPIPRKTTSTLLAFNRLDTPHMPPQRLAPSPHNDCTPSHHH